MRKHRRYTDEEITEACKNSISISDVLRSLYGRDYGSSVTHMGNRIRKLGIDTSHFRRYGLNPPQKKKTADEILVIRNAPTTKVLRWALIESQVPYICETCKRPPSWEGKKLTLQIDHIDGDRNNNEKKNLRFLCPNCHSQTTTWGKNRTVTRTKEKKTFIRKTKIDWPPNDELRTMVFETPVSTLAKKLGVSDKAISKRCNKFNIPVPSPGHWMKKNSAAHGI